jgi:hypothetical protein
MATPAPLPKTAFDLRVTLETPLRQFVPWLAAVLLVTWAGYPGVVCVTPMAWLIALRVGLLCAMFSHSPRSNQRVQEAAVAGGVLGFLQGLLFFFILPRMGPVSASEQASATGLALGMLCAGIFAAAALSAFNAWLFLRRREAERTS